MGFDYLEFWTEEKTKEESEKEKAFKETENLKPLSFSISNKVLIVETLHESPQRQRVRDLNNFFVKNESKILKELKRV